MREVSSSFVLQKATKEKLDKFNTIRGKEVKPGEFWDLVVITAADEDQRASYELQIQEKCKRKELPLGISYLVFADPPGYKIGNGGSTLHSVQLLSDQYGESLSRCRVILIHAGGFSQRLPNASALGKIFTALPLGEPLYQMLELKLAMYVDFPSHMKPGMLVTCADDIELYSVNDNIMFDKPGFTALAHPSPLSIGTTHGVFVLEPTEHTSVRDLEYRTCYQFLHKPSIERMFKCGAVWKKADCDFVYTDSTYYVDYATMLVLLNMFNQIRPLRCEVDAYGDFLQGLGPGATVDYTNNTSNVTKMDDSLVEIRKKVYNCLSGTPLNVVVLNNSKFYHLGTTEEYLFHFTADPCPRAELGFLPASFSIYQPVALGKATACVMHSVLHSSASVSTGSVVEYSRLEAKATVGTRAIVSGCWVGTGLSVPEETFIHSLNTNQNGRTSFVTIAFSIRDDLKKSVSSPADMDQLEMFGAPLVECVSHWGLCSEDIRFSGDGSMCNLWNCCIFPVCLDMKSSFAATLKMVWAVCRKEKVTLSRNTRLLSLQEILQKKDLEQMLGFRKRLYEEIIAAK